MKRGMPEDWIGMEKVARMMFARYEHPRHLFTLLSKIIISSGIHISIRSTIPIHPSCCRRTTTYLYADFRGGG